MNKPIPLPVLPSAGRTLTAALRRYFSVGARTRRHGRNARDLHASMIEALIQAATEPAGFFGEATQAALRPGYVAALAYRKHVAGCRIGADVVAAVNVLSPWRFAAFLGDFVDAGVGNVGEAEGYLRRRFRPAPAKG